MYSIRIRFVIIYLLLAVIVLGLVGIVVFSLVEDYFVNQRINDEIKIVNNAAVTVAPYVEASDAVSIYNLLSGQSREQGGRFLVVNNSGIVQSDSFSALNGTYLDYYEIRDIIQGKKPLSYDLHLIKGNNENENFWTVYYAAGIRSGGSSLGVLVYSSSIQDVADAMNKLKNNMLYIYFMGCVVIIIVSVVSTDIIIKPVKKLTVTANKISNGDLSERVDLKGKSEIAEFGRTFNMMCDKIQDVDMQRQEFVSNASHELKTPLASMKILVESILYQDNVEEKYYKEFLTDVDTEIDRLTNLINDLLLLTKMDSNIASLNIEHVNINELIDKITNNLLPIAKMRNIDMRIEMKTIVYADCDKGKIYQAINNLVENAIKYSKDNGFVRIVLGKSGDHFTVLVKDNGIGIPKENIPHVFERFYRVDKARSRETGGSGLGLHIVRKIALIHNGSVNVRSEENLGSTFILNIPLSYKEEDPKQKKQ